MTDHLERTGSGAGAGEAALGGGEAFRENTELLTPVATGDSEDPTATLSPSLPTIRGDHETLPEALDYAARGDTGFNFYSVRGQLGTRMTYTELRERAIDLAHRLVRSGIPKGARLAMIAETTPDFMIFFFGCQYAGIVPVPLPLSLNQGSRDTYVGRLGQLVRAAGADSAMASSNLLRYLREGVGGQDLRLVGTPEDFYNLPRNGTLRPFGKDDPGYLQYSSGSTQFPKGVEVTQRSLTSNCRGIIRNGLNAVAGDRGTSWLPLYHDMGLVGFCITPLMVQISVDYIATADFARRALLWPELISRNRGTVSFSPTFGYDLCIRRARGRPMENFDLSHWKVAGIGGDMVRAKTLDEFYETFAPCGFRKAAFVPSYGLAESTLAVCFAPLGQGVEVDRIDTEAWQSRGVAVPAPAASGNGANGNGASGNGANGNGANGNGANGNGANGNGADEAGPEDCSTRDFVVFGTAMPEHEIEIRDTADRILPERSIGRVIIRGPSIMAGYYGNPEETARVLSEDGWLDTGDMGYLIDGRLVISGRSKDLIICNGRNIWPQDIEWAVERLPEVRSGSVAAFSVPGVESEKVVLTVECRLTDDEERRLLKKEIHSTVKVAAGVDGEVVLVPAKTLAYTSSGKLSRATMRDRFLAGDYDAHIADPAAAAPAAGEDVTAMRAAGNA